MTDSEIGSLHVSVAGRTIMVRGRSVVTIGRAPDADLVVDHPLISREHAVVRSTADGWVLEDRGSRNGIYVGSERVERAAIGPSGLKAHLGAEDGVALDVAWETPWPPATQPLSAVAPSIIRLGRDSDNEIVLADDLLVSRHQAVIYQTPSGREIEDLGSHNGTYLNGQQVGRAPIRPGDVIGIGQRQFRVTPSGAIEEWTGGEEARFACSGLVVRASTGTVLLDGVDIRLGQNAFLAVVGPSGAGKTTLLNALTGTSPADEGTVWYEGRNLYNNYDDLRWRLGIVPQDDVLHPQLTVRRALAYAAELRFSPEVSKSERLRRVDEVIGELGLTQRAHLPIQRLSGGQRKRVSVALELLTKPSLLFLDEPTSGLDPGYERSLMQLLRDLADGGRTVVVVTHSVSSLQLCDRVLVMAPGGKPAYFGAPADAPAFFGQADYQGVFQALTDDSEGEWPRRFSESDQRRRYLPSLPREVDTGPRPTPPPPRRGGLRQFSTLMRRNLRVLRSDRVNIALMVAQAPVVGLLQFVVLPRGELAPPIPGQARLFSSAAVILLNPVQVATALGMTNAVRELVKERSVFRRERAVGLSIPTYLLSKVTILATVAALQALILMALTLLHEGGPRDALALTSSFIELTTVVALTGIAGVGLGMLISALATTENMAMTILPVALVLQNVLSMGGLSPDALKKPVLNQLQYASSAQWGFAAAAATADLNKLQGLSSVVKDLKTVDATTATNLLNKPIRTQGQRRYRHVLAAWMADVGALLAMTVAALLACGLALARMDPALIR